MNNNENKTHDNFGRGITLIIIGVFALLITFFDFKVDWHIIGDLWPMILIIIGVCIMPINRWIRTVIALVLLAVGFIAYQSRVCDTTKVINETEITSTFNGDDDY